MRIAIAAALLCATLIAADTQPPMPDPKLTPGDADPRLTRDVLCSPRFRTGKYRKVSSANKKRVYRAYGRQKQGATCCEVDHLISLELGGSNAIENLWPEPYLPAPGAREKDALENRLHRMVCAGDITLAAAQHAIATDWWSAYQRYVTPRPKRKVKP